MAKKGDIIFLAQVTTEDTAEVNFVGEELYEDWKKYNSPYTMKVKVIECQGKEG